MCSKTNTRWSSRKVPRYLEEFAVLSLGMTAGWSADRV